MLLGLGFGFDDDLSNPIWRRIDETVSPVRSLNKNPSIEHLKSTKFQTSHRHAREFGRLGRLPTQEIQLLLLIMQHHRLKVLRQQLEASVVEIFLFWPRAGLGSLVADADVAGRPAARQARQVIHLLADHLWVLGRLFSILALRRHRNLDWNCASGQRRRAWRAVEAGVALVLPQLGLRRRNVLQAVRAEVRIHLRMWNESWNQFETFLSSHSPHGDNRMRSEGSGSAGRSRASLEGLRCRTNTHIRRFSYFPRRTPSKIKGRTTFCEVKLITSYPAKRLLMLICKSFARLLSEVIANNQWLALVKRVEIFWWFHHHFC